MRVKLTLAILLAAAMATVVMVRASSYTFLGSMATVDNATSNSVGLAVQTLYGSGTIYVQKSGLVATNDLRVNVQFSADNTNWITVASYYPSTTNAGTETWTPSIAGTLYLRTQAVTTNSVQVGVVYQY